MRKEVAFPVTDNPREAFRRAWRFLGSLGGGAWEVVIREPRRSLSQNDKLWPMLRDVAGQCQLVIDGELTWAKPEDWKDVFTAALRHHQRVARGIDGGVVFLGLSTSKMRKREFSDLVELIYAYGAEHQVRWSDPAIAAFEQYREAG